MYGFHGSLNCEFKDLDTFWDVDTFGVYSTLYSGGPTFHPWARMASVSGSYFSCFVLMV